MNVLETHPDELQGSWETLEYVNRLEAALRSSEAVERDAALELGADMCIRMARSESSVGHDKEASILEAAAFAIRALKRPWR